MDQNSNDPVHTDEINNVGIDIAEAIKVLVGRDVLQPILKREKAAPVAVLDEEKKKGDVVKAVTFNMFHAKRNV